MPPKPVTDKRQLLTPDLPFEEQKKRLSKLSFGDQLDEIGVLNHDDQLKHVGMMKADMLKTMEGVRKKLSVPPLTGFPGLQGYSTASHYKMFEDAADAAGKFYNDMGDFLKKNPHLTETNKIYEISKETGLEEFGKKYNSSNAFDKKLGAVIGLHRHLQALAPAISDTAVKEDHDYRAKQASELDFYNLTYEELITHEREIGLQKQLAIHAEERQKEQAIFEAKEAEQQRAHQAKYQEMHLKRQQEADAKVKAEEAKVKAEHERVKINQQMAISRLNTAVLGRNNSYYRIERDQLVGRQKLPVNRVSYDFYQDFLKRSV